MIKNNILFILIAILLFIGCIENNPGNKNNASNNTLSSKLVSTIFQIAPNYDAEINYDHSTNNFTIMINDNKCHSSLNLPDKNKITNELRISVDDYNFDGYKDFAIITGSNNNYQYYTNLFNSETREFVAFQTFANLTVDYVDKLLADNTIISADNQLKIIYEINGFDRINEKKHIQNITYKEALNMYNGEIGTLAYVQNTVYYDNNGENPVSEKKLLTQNGEIATYTIQGRRVYLYGTPTTKRKTNMYLVKGDKVELLDITDGFFKIKFKNPKYGDIIKWIRYNNGKEL